MYEVSMDGWMEKTDFLTRTKASHNVRSLKRGYDMVQDLHIRRAGCRKRGSTNVFIDDLHTGQIA